MKCMYAAKTTLISLSPHLVVGLDSRNKQGVDDGFVTVSLKTDKGMHTSFISWQNAPFENGKKY